MPLEEEHIFTIRTAFETMRTKEDLLSLLNVVKEIIYQDKAHPFKMNQLNWYSNPASSKKRYKQFKIAKKTGGERIINAPVSGLKAIQKCLAIILQCIFEPHKAAMGFVPGKSIVDNARIHQGSIYVYNIDLKDFFPSVEQARVWACFQLKPFNLTGGRSHFANIIASVCCMETEQTREHSKTGKITPVNVLPQGAPTSPVVTNIVCQKLDFLLTAVAKRFNLKYSRYADDITFSSAHNVYKTDSTFINELNRIIAEQRFVIKESKTRLQKEGYRQEVTGLLVNEKVNVQKRYIKQLRMWLYYWERYGYDRAYNFFIKQYMAGKTSPVKGKPDMGNVIAGKLEYLKMVKSVENERYLKLKKKFGFLKQSTNYEKTVSGGNNAPKVFLPSDPNLTSERDIEKTLDLIIEKGYEAAFANLKSSANG